MVKDWEGVPSQPGYRGSPVRQKGRTAVPVHNQDFTWQEPGP